MAWGLIDAVFRKKEALILPTPFDEQVTDLSYDIKKEFSQSNVILFSYARQAIIQALSLLKLKKDDPVYLPAFICSEVIEAVNFLNLKIHYYDVDSSLNPILDNNLSTKAILVVNYFGFPQKIFKIKDYCQKHNSYFIEDNAQGFLSKNHEGKLLGTIGDVGILSIRKSVFLPNGAALLINNESLKKDKIIGAKIQQTGDDKQFKKKQIIKKIIKYTSPRLGTAILLSRKMLRGKKENDQNIQPEQPLTPLLKSGFIPINKTKERARRIELFDVIKRYALKFNIQPIIDLKSKNVIPYAFPFYAKDVSEFSRYLLRKNFYILNWPDLPTNLNDDQKRRYQNVWMVPFLW